MGKVRDKLRFLLRRHPLLYRFRYALITRLGDRCFDAVPPAAGTITRPPDEYHAAVRRLDLTGDDGFDDARKIAFDLSRGHRRGPGLGLTSTEALEHIYSGRRGGVCSDYTQVFLGLCLAGGVRAREWGLCASFERSTLGHTLAEVYCHRHEKWAFLDPLYSIYATRPGDDVPLSVTEMVDLVCAGRADDVAIHLIDPDGKPGAKRDHYVDRYFQPDHAFFLLVENDVFGQDAFLKWVGVLPPSIVHLAMIVAGRYQKYRVYANATNRTDMSARIDRLRAWRRRLTLSTLGALAAAAAGVVGLIELARR